jgi:hypothetical protein
MQQIAIFTGKNIMGGTGINASILNITPFNTVKKPSGFRMAFLHEKI